MLSKIRKRREAAEEDAEEDTKAFLLNRKVTVKEETDAKLEYQIGEFLGSGKFGDVNRCVEKKTGNELAAKIIPISSSDEKEAVMNEVVIMCRLRHPRLIQLYDVFVLRDKITLIMELITGGELFERVIDDNFELDEATCEKFMREILQGVEYIHSQRVIHLDLKPENILCLSRTGFKIKIIDFGLARETTDSEVRVMFGTPEFVAPEVISFDPVTFATDMWSVGVVCYVLLSGLSPFMGDNESETLSNIVRCNYTFDYPEFNDISAEAKNFIKNLLQRDPKKRHTASMCLEHPWLKVKPRLKRTATVSKKRLRHFVYRRKWQKAVNAIIALQRMGVVLTQPSKEPEYRKLLQAKSTKTAALLKKSSLQGDRPKELEIAINRSVVASNDCSIKAQGNSDPFRKSVSKESSRSPQKQPQAPQINVINPTEKLSDIPLTSKGPTNSESKPSQDSKPLSAPSTPKGLASQPDKTTTNVVPQKSVISPDSRTAKATPSQEKPQVPSATFPPESKEPTEISTPTPTTQYQKTYSFQNAKTTNPSNRPSTAPAFQNVSKPMATENSESTVMRIVKLSTTSAGGSVADRISFFNKPDNKKRANKKFSLFN